LFHPPFSLTHRILILGLNNAGKTTILYKLFAPHCITRTIPTIGFNVETVQHRGLKFCMWDLGGQTDLRPFWRCYYSNTNAVIYVVDSTDHERMSIARREMFAMFQEEELRGVHLLVFANKQDDPRAMKPVEVARELGLHTIKDRRWHICATSAIKGEGLTEGLDWLSDVLTGKEPEVAPIEQASTTSTSTTVESPEAPPAPAAAAAAAADSADSTDHK